MARSLRVEFDNAFYHITSRGIERRSIFCDRYDRNRFLFYLHENLQRYEVILFAYALMRNHYHLFIQTLMPNLSRFMHDINTSYTVYFNKRRGRVGPLLQGRYKAILVDSETYFLELSRYIHLNPVRAGRVVKAEDYMWSSYRVYLGYEQDRWIDLSWVKERFGRRWRAKYRQFVKEGIGAENPFDNVKVGFILGSDAFMDEIKDMINLKDVDREVPASRELMSPTLDAIIERTSRHFHVSIGTILSRSRDCLPRKVALLLVRELTQASVGTIAKAFGVGYPAISKAVGRIRAETLRNRKMRQAIKSIKGELLCL